MQIGLLDAVQVDAGVTHYALREERQREILSTDFVHKAVDKSHPVINSLAA